MTASKTRDIKVENIHEAPGENPNTVDDMTMAMLTEAIRKRGFLQPILCRALPTGDFEVIDGHHRLAAARSIGMEKIPVVVVDADTETSVILQVGMNRMRGDLDLAKVGRLAKNTLDHLHVTVAQLAPDMGFSPQELNNIIEGATAASSQDLLDQASSRSYEPDEVESTTAAKPFVLELAFKDRRSIQAARRGLRRAAGKTNDLARGLLRLLGAEEKR